jgi:hypothetical protein
VGVDTAAGTSFKGGIKERRAGRRFVDLYFTISAKQDSGRINGGMSDNTGVDERMGA